MPRPPACRLPRPAFNHVSQTQSRIRPAGTAQERNGAHPPLRHVCTDYTPAGWLLKGIARQHQICRGSEQRYPHPRISVSLRGTAAGTPTTVPDFRSSQRSRTRLPPHFTSSVPSACKTWPTASQPQPSSCLRGSTSGGDVAHQSPVQPNPKIENDHPGVNEINVGRGNIPAARAGRGISC